MAEYHITEGTTKRQDFILKADGVAVNLTGQTVTLLLKDRDGTTIDTTGDVTVPDAANGKVGYKPDTADLTAAKSPYSAKWKVADGTGDVDFHPSGEPDVWVVHRQV